MPLRWIVVTLVAAILPACDKPIGENHPTPIQENTPLKPVEKPVLTEVEQITALIDPVKLATLKSRGSNPRICKITAILYSAKTAGKNPANITDEAINKIGWGGTEKGKLTAAAILRNLDIAEKLGSTTPEDLIAMRKGQSPIVRRGPSTGDVLSVDHIIPCAIAPELENVICNLELMPLKLNQSKNDSIGDRQRNLAKKLHAAGLMENSHKIR